MKTVHISENLHKQLKVKAAKEGTQINTLVAHFLWDKLGGARAANVHEKAQK